MTIETLRCPGGGAVSFDLWGVYGDRLFLCDLQADWNGYLSVSEAAAEVCRHCHRHYGNKRIICLDAARKWYELLQDNGAFEGVAPYRETVPFRVRAALSLREAATG